MDPTFVTHLYNITDNIGCVLTGMKREWSCALRTEIGRVCYVGWSDWLFGAADGMQLLAKAREVAGEFRYNYGYDIPVHYLAKRMADENQVPLCLNSGCCPCFMVIVILSCVL